MFDYLDVVRQIVEQRRTVKVLANVDDPVRFDEDTIIRSDRMVKQVVASAGLAPFHYVRGFEDIAEPWRAYFLNWESCRQLSRKFPEWVNLKPTNKVPAMLAACGCLLLVTWIPQFRSKPNIYPDPSPTDIPSKNQIQIDDEHLAATAAFVQNILILATAAGLGSYWSSGGGLDSPEVFRQLKISQEEKLLAALFIEYSSNDTRQLERINGKNHPLRSSVDRWFRNLELGLVENSNEI